MTGHHTRDLADHDPEELVAASFEFLLAREPREAILPRFAVSVIERYFPGYEAAMRARIADRQDGSGLRVS